MKSGRAGRAGERGGGNDGVVGRAACCRAPAAPCSLAGGGFSQRSVREQIGKELEEGGSGQGAAVRTAAAAAVAGGGSGCDFVLAEEVE